MFTPQSLREASFKRLLPQNKIMPRYRYSDEGEPDIAGQKGQGNESMAIRLTDKQIKYLKQMFHMKAFH